MVAVSGGVDSVVLLHMLVKRYAPEQLIVAHFDHGIRGDDSRADARFVTELAKRYGAQYIAQEGNLTADASEDVARQARYGFLRRVAREYGDIPIVTAHHADDLVETVAINLERGTGWRGLAVFGAKNILRPLLHMRKRDIYEYALRHSLEWVEDSTNQQLQYLRNRLRRRTAQFDDSLVTKLCQLHVAQHKLVNGVEQEVSACVQRDTPQSRYFFTMVDSTVACELLRHYTDARLTRPQLQQALLAIKTARPGTTHEAGNGVQLRFTTREFIASHR